MQENLLKQILFELKELKSGQEILKSDVSELKKGQKNLELGQKSLEEGQLELKNDVNEFKMGQQRIEAKLDAAYEKVAENSEGIAEIRFNLTQHANFMGALNQRITNLENKEIRVEG